MKNYEFFTFYTSVHSIPLSASFFISIYHITNRYSTEHRKHTHSLTFSIQYFIYHFTLMSVLVHALNQ